MMIEPTYPEAGWEIYAEERFVVEVQCRIQKLMNLKGVSGSELARRLGLHPRMIDQMLDDDAEGLTIRMMARVFAALGEECVVTWSNEGDV